MTALHDHAQARAALVPEERVRLGRRAQLLAWASVTYNAVEAVVALGAGVVAGSAALVGFGLGSVIEVSSGLVIMWQFRHRLPESREQSALRFIALSFFTLAGYVAVDSVRALTATDLPDPSPVGIALAATSLVVMPFLSWAQRRTGRASHSSAVIADSTQTLLCTYLSGVLLAGLLLNATLGWGWADPVAGLLIAALAAKEGRNVWQGKGCCGSAMSPGAAPTATACADGPATACAAPTATACAVAPATAGADAKPADDAGTCRAAPSGCGGST